VRILLAEQLGELAMVVEMEFERIFAGRLEDRFVRWRAWFACDDALVSGG